MNQLVHEPTGTCRNSKTDRPLILLVGASCRSAAQCATRAGYHAWAADLFQDRDLVECANVASIEDLLLRDHAWWPRLEGSSLVLCGGAENQPDLVDTLLQRRLHCGLQPGTLSLLRSTEQWECWANASGIRWPKTLPARSRASHPGDESGWLIKSSSAAGGLGVRVFGEDLIRDGDYLQQRVQGEVLGVSFLSGVDRSWIIGCAQSWTSDSFPAPLPFLYRGSVGPIEVSETEANRLLRFAEIVRERTKLLGLWQADFVKNEEGWWLLEINPRWSSSMELFDTFLGVRLISLHVQAIAGHFIGDGELDGLWRFDRRWSGFEPIRYIGKVVRYAMVPIQPTSQTLDDWWTHRWCGTVAELNSQNRLADIPGTTEAIPSGYPIFTEFAGGSSLEEVQDRLGNSHFSAVGEGASS